MSPLQDKAHAKINLFLHVTGRRPDGYHLLDSLVVFAEAGDKLFLKPAPLPSIRLWNLQGLFLKA
ncbi:hypothetical protein [Aristophania vespae]|uniref:hypothetical protein n=1 Tax=Aristophania vespae TaxID=2697033 RepID=UPI001F2D2D0B|nr:hypothetical protein [Aristophania vespae]